MKNIFILLFVICTVTACQHKSYPVNTPVANTEVKRAGGQAVILGHAPLAVFNQPVCKPWFDKSYDAYSVDTNNAKILQPLFRNITVNIFLGSWCGDSRREVPRMFKVLQTAGVDTSNVSVVFVDNVQEFYKQSPGGEERNRNIHRVPTFILYEDHKELGRIVESPVVSLEKDLQTILSHQPYQPTYQGVDYWIHHAPADNHVLADAELQSMAATIKPLCKHYGEFNTYGYVQLAAKKYKMALNVFRLNTLMYPQTPGVFDSLGEALEKTGDKQGAIKAYEKVLALKPGDENAGKRLMALRGS